MIDSTHAKAHRSAAGGKGGSRSRRLAAQERAQHEGPCTRRCSGPSSRHPPDRGRSAQLPGRGAAHRPRQSIETPDRRQGLRQRRVASVVEGSRNQASHSRPQQKKAAVQLQQAPLQRTTAHRERLRQVSVSDLWNQIRSGHLPLPIVTAIPPERWSFPTAPIRNRHAPKPEPQVRRTCMAR